MGPTGASTRLAGGELSKLTQRKGCRMTRSDPAGGPGREPVGRTLNGGPGNPLGRKAASVAFGARQGLAVQDPAVSTKGGRERSGWGRKAGCFASDGGKGHPALVPEPLPSDRISRSRRTDEIPSGSARDKTAFSRLTGCALRPSPRATGSPTSRRRHPRGPARHSVVRTAGGGCTGYDGVRFAQVGRRRVSPGLRKPPCARGGTGASGSNGRRAEADPARQGHRGTRRRRDCRGSWSTRSTRMSGRALDCTYGAGWGPGGEPPVHDRLGAGLFDGRGYQILDDGSVLWMTSTTECSKYRNAHGGLRGRQAATLSCTPTRRGDGLPSRSATGGSKGPGEDPRRAGSGSGRSGAWVS